MVDRKAKLEPFRYKFPDELKGFILRIPLKAKAKARARIAKGGKSVYKDPKDKLWGKALRALIEDRYDIKDVLDDRKGLTMISIVEVATKDKTRWGEPVVRRPDVSNYLKNIEDELTGLVYRDDAGIYQSYILKIYNDRDYLTIIIVPGMEYKEVLDSILSGMCTILSILTK